MNLRIIHCVLLLKKIMRQIDQIADFVIYGQ